MTYKLFIDDERLPKEDNWIVARSTREAIEIVKKLGFPSEIAFDHDLGGDDTTMKFIWWFIEQHMVGEMIIEPFEFSVHSQNPIGSENIKHLLNSFFKELNVSKST